MFEVWWDLYWWYYYKCFSNLDSAINLKICQYLMKLRCMQIKRTKKVSVFLATWYKVNVLTRNIKHMWLLQPMKILLECCIPAKSLSHASLVIINWLTAGQIEDWISITSCIRALVYPQRFKEVQPPLNVFNCVFAQNTVQALLLCSLYPKCCTGKR